MGHEITELEQLKKENERLTQQIETLTTGYVGLFTANLRSGKIEFQKVAKSLLEHFGVPGEIPIWEDYVSLYIRNGVHPDDQATARAFLDRDHLREHLECGHSITKAYRNDRGVWGEMKLIRIDEDTIWGGTSLTSPQHLPNGDKLVVQCFGWFEVFWRGAPLHFPRRKAKELFAFLIDREGAACTAEEIADALWEDVSDLQTAKHRLRTIISELRAALRAVGMEDVLIRDRRQLAVRRDRIDCDYYRLLAGDADAAGAWRGEYMRQYSWAEQTAGKLNFRSE